MQEQPTKHASTEPKKVDEEFRMLFLLIVSLLDTQERDLDVKTVHLP